MITIPVTQNKMIRKTISLFTAITFIFSSIATPGAMAQGLNLPAPGTMVGLTAAFTPVIIQGVNIDPQDPLKFDFIIDQGDSKLEGDAFNEEATKLVKYFLAAMTVPQEQMWVNLSPYEKDRIIPETFGSTEMGRDLLAQDYMLKQLTSSLLYPEDELGAKFWEKVYAEAKEKYGTTDVPTDTFNKIWIVPETASIYEHSKGAFIVDAHLKVMLEEDYIALAANKGRADTGVGDVKADEMRQMTETHKQILREIIVPAVEKEVNEGTTFANLRQIHHSMLLAKWYKERLQQSLLGQVYADKGKVEGVNSDPAQNQEIYNQYVEAFKKGVYDFVKEDYNSETQEVIPRKYFSGGIVPSAAQYQTKDVNNAMLSDRVRALAVGAAVILAVALSAPNVNAETPSTQKATTAQSSLTSTDWTIEDGKAIRYLKVQDTWYKQTGVIVDGKPRRSPVPTPGLAMPKGFEPPTAKEQPSNKALIIETAFQRVTVTNDKGEKITYSKAGDNNWFKLTGDKTEEMPADFNPMLSASAEASKVVTSKTEQVTVTAENGERKVYRKIGDGRWFDGAKEMPEGFSPQESAENDFNQRKAAVQKQADGWNKYVSFQNRLGEMKDKAVDMANKGDNKGALAALNKGLAEFQKEWVGYKNELSGLSLESITDRETGKPITAQDLVKQVEVRFHNTIVDMFNILVNEYNSNLGAINADQKAAARDKMQELGKQAEDLLKTPQLDEKLKDALEKLNRAIKSRIERLSSANVDDSTAPALATLTPIDQGDTQYAAGFSYTGDLPEVFNAAMLMAEQITKLDDRIEADRKAGDEEGVMYGMAERQRLQNQLRTALDSQITTLAARIEADRKAGDEQGVAYGEIELKRLEVQRKTLDSAMQSTAVDSALDQDVKNVTDALRTQFASEVGELNFEIKPKTQETVTTVQVFIVGKEKFKEGFDGRFRAALRAQFGTLGKGIAIAAFDPQGMKEVAYTVTLTDRAMNSTLDDQALEQGIEDAIKFLDGRFQDAANVTYQIQPKSEDGKTTVQVRFLGRMTVVKGLDEDFREQMDEVFGALGKDVVIATVTNPEGRRDGEYAVTLTDRAPEIVLQEQALARDIEKVMEGMQGRFQDLALVNYRIRSNPEQGITTVRVLVMGAQRFYQGLDEEFRAELNKAFGKLGKGLAIATVNNPDGLLEGSYTVTLTDQETDRILKNRALEQDIKGVVEALPAQAELSGILKEVNYEIKPKSEDTITTVQVFVVGNKEFDGRFDETFRAALNKLFGALGKGVAIAGFVPTGMKETAYTVTLTDWAMTAKPVDVNSGEYLSAFLKRNGMEGNVEQFFRLNPALNENPNRGDLILGTITLFSLTSKAIVIDKAPNPAMTVQEFNNLLKGISTLSEFAQRINQGKDFEGLRRLVIDGVTNEQNLLLEGMVGQLVKDDSYDVSFEMVPSKKQAIVIIKRTVGGIDLNPGIVQMNIANDGKPFEMTLPTVQEIKAMEGVNGFVPVIINVQPITNLPLLLGMNEEAQEGELSRLN